MKAIKTFLLGSAVAFSSTVFAQADYNFGKTPTDSTECVKNYSLYTEYYKQKNYSSALEPLKQTYKYCPKLHKSIYINGAKVYKSLIKKEEDVAKKQALYTEYLSVFDNRIKYFGDEGFVLGRKGMAMYRDENTPVAESHAVLMKSFNLQGNESEANPLYYLFKAEYKLYKEGAKTKQDVINFYPKISDALNANINDKEKSDKSKKAYISVATEVEKLFSKIASCEDIVAIYDEKFKATPDDAELLKTITSTLEKSKCTDSDLFFKVASKMHELNPTAESAYALGLNQKDNCSKAAPYFKQAAELSSDNDFKEKAYLNAAKCYLSSRSYSNAKSFALKVIAINPNSGTAYMVIGNAYASGASGIGENSCEKKAGYWAACDKFAKAKAVDPSVAEKAQSSLNKFSGYFPGKEDCFFYNITEGSSYKVGGWIGETTTARFYK